MLFIVRQDYVSVEAINDYVINISKDKLIGCVFNDIYEFKNKKKLIDEQVI